MEETAEILKWQSAMQMEARRKIHLALPPDIHLRLKAGTDPFDSFDNRIAEYDENQEGMFSVDEIYVLLKSYQERARQHERKLVLGVLVLYGVPLLVVVVCFLFAVFGAPSWTGEGEKLTWVWPAGLTFGFVLGHVIRIVYSRSKAKVKAHDSWP
jgi:hypothetical protein